MHIEHFRRTAIDTVKSGILRSTKAIQDAQSCNNADTFLVAQQPLGQCASAVTCNEHVVHFAVCSCILLQQHSLQCCSIAL